MSPSQRVSTHPYYDPPYLHNKKIAYFTFVVPSILYPIRASNLSMADLKGIQKPLLPMIYHGRHMHHNVTQDYVFGLSTFRGLEIPVFDITTNVHLWEILRDHLEQDDPTKTLLMVSIGYAQIAVVSGTQFLSLPCKG